MLANEVIPLVVGFLLTTVLGGLLGTWLQQRIWKRQNEVQLRQDELRRAEGVCQQVSQLLDKRLYRMRRFYFALASDPELPERSERIQSRLKEYDTLLYEWNDSLNLNLALMGASDAASAALVAEVIRRCPSGALHYRAPDMPLEQPDVPTTIRVVERRGPFLVRGDLQIHTADGPVTDTRAALCRCTRSARQPFCDAACNAPEPSSPPGRPEE